jgi:hypothetical protein
MIEHSTHFIVRKTSGGKDGNFLTTGNGVHGVNGGDTSLNHFFRINTRIWVDGLA